MRTKIRSVVDTFQFTFRGQLIAIISGVMLAGAAHSAEPILTVQATDPVTAATPWINVYPAANGQTNVLGSEDLVYTAGTRVWLRAPLRVGSQYFVKWQKDGVDFDTASTISFVHSDNHVFRPVYIQASCTGLEVQPGIDSIKNAVAQSPAGTTFCIKAGIHRFTSAVVPRNGDQFIGEPGAILNGSKEIGPFVKVGNFWVVTGQTQQEPTFPATNCINANVPNCMYPEKVFINSRELRQVVSLTSLRSGSFYFDYNNDKIYLADDPNGRIVEATTGSGGITGFSGGRSDNVTVRFLTIQKFGGGKTLGSGHDAFKATDGWVVENNEFSYLSNAGVANYGNGLVRNNYIAFNGRYGITGSGTFEGNVIVGNNTDGFFKAFGGGSKFLRTNGVVVRGNTATANNGRGFWADYDNINVTYENNIIRGNTEAGIFHEASCAAVIRNNVLARNNTANKGTSVWHGGQIYTRSSMDVEIVGNDVTASGYGQNGIAIRADRTGYNMPNCGSTTAGNIYVHDNTIRMETGHFSGVVAGEAGYASARNIHYANNKYSLQNLNEVHFVYENTNPTNKEGWVSRGQDTGVEFGYFLR